MKKGGGCKAKMERKDDRSQRIVGSVGGGGGGRGGEEVGRKQYE